MKRTVGQLAPGTRGWVWLHNVYQAHDGRVFVHSGAEVSLTRRIDGSALALQRAAVEAIGDGMRVTLPRGYRNHLVRRADLSSIKRLTPAREVYHRTRIPGRHVRLDVPDGRTPARELE